MSQCGSIDRVNVVSHTRHPQLWIISPTILANYLRAYCKITMHLFKWMTYNPMSLGFLAMGNLPLHIRLVRILCMPLWF